MDQASRPRHFGDRPGEDTDCNAVMLIIVAEEREDVVFECYASMEEGGVELYHLAEVFCCRFENDMSQILRL
jgi:hypothetical protein